MQYIYNFYRNRKQVLTITSKEELTDTTLSNLAKELGENVTYDVIKQSGKYNTNIGTASHFRIGDDYFM